MLGVDVGAYPASSVYAGGNEYGYDTGAYGYASGFPGSTYVVPPPAYEDGGPAYYGAPAYVGGGYARGPGWYGHGEDWRRRTWQNNAAQPPRAQRSQQEKENAALYRQQVQQNCEATYQRQVQGERGEVPAASPAESLRRSSSRTRPGISSRCNRTQLPIRGSCSTREKGRPPDRLPLPRPEHPPARQSFERHAGCPAIATAGPAPRPSAAAASATPWRSADACRPRRPR